MAPTFTLPDFFAEWPFLRTPNPYYNDAVSSASAEWLSGFGILDEKERDAFNRHKISLLAALTYPRVDSAHFRLACDFLAWTFLLDEAADSSDSASFRDLTTRIMDALRDPFKPRSAGQSKLESLTMDFWSRSVTYSYPTPAKGFVEAMDIALEAICQELDDRDRGRMRSIDEYLALRRGTSGMAPCYYFVLLAMELPQEVINNPQLKNLAICATDMVILSNDVISWNRERSLGIDDHNMVSVVMEEKGFDIQDAIDYVGEWYRKELKKFVEDKDNLPQFSESIDPLVSEYVYGMANWVTGFLEWAFEGGRYFGPKGLEIKSSRVVELRPKKSGDGA